jgi:hypothetical protein
MELPVVSKELSRRLKEVNFNLFVSDHYSTHDNFGEKNDTFRDAFDHDIFNWNDYPFCYISNRDEELSSAPTLALACMWFREVHSIDIVPHLSSFEDRTYDSEVRYGKQRNFVFETNSTYEHAIEIALFKACDILDISTTTDTKRIHTLGTEIWRIDYETMSGTKESLTVRVDVQSDVEEVILGVDDMFKAQGNNVRIFSQKPWYDDGKGNSIRIK